MPIKEFECQACRHRFEEILGIHEPVPEKCPKCGGGPLKQLLGTFRIAGASRKSEPEGDFGADEGPGAGGDFGAGDEMGGMEDFGGGGDEDFGEGPEPPEDAGSDDSGAGPGEEPGGDDDKGNAE